MDPEVVPSEPVSRGFLWNVYLYLHSHAYRIHRERESREFFQSLDEFRVAPFDGHVTEWPGVWPTLDCWLGSNTGFALEVAWNRLSEEFKERIGNEIRAYFKPIVFPPGEPKLWELPRVRL